ncbi:MAG: glycosyltransferase family 4 protein [Candidatus Rokuibacteriota bacterium]
MRIAIDARLWGEPRSGIGRYTRALAETLVRIAPTEQWILYLDRPAEALPVGAEVRCLPWPQRLVWTLYAVSRDLRGRPVDLFHGVTGFELPWSRTCRLVTTVHDLIPLRFPRLVPWRHRWAVRALLGSALRRAARVIVDSAATRAEILERYRIPADKIQVVLLAANARLAPPTAAERAETRARYALTRPYVLFVGLLEPKKNLPTLLRAVARLRSIDGWGPIELILVGAPGWGPLNLSAEVARLNLRGTVRLLGPVPEADLPALYAEALAFVLPSLWEGFGLPVLEAMAAGAPVIASRRGALPEVAGEAALLVEPEVEPLAAALGTVLADPRLRERLREAGLARAAGFSWERVATETLSVYRAAVR